MNKPTSLKELFVHFAEHPRVRITDHHGVTTLNQYSSWFDGRLFFQKLDTETDPGRTLVVDEPHFLPINCKLTDAASQAEAGITFDDTGFTFTKFGHSIRVEYVDE